MFFREYLFAVVNYKYFVIQGERVRASRGILSRIVIKTRCNCRDVDVEQLCTDSDPIQLPIPFHSNGRQLIDVKLSSDMIATIISRKLSPQTLKC